MYTWMTTLRSHTTHQSHFPQIIDQMPITSGEYSPEIFLIWIVFEILHCLNQRIIFLYLRPFDLLACIMSHNHCVQVAQITLSLSAAQSQVRIDLFIFLGFKNDFTTLSILELIICSMNQLLKRILCSTFEWRDKYKTSRQL